MTGLRLKSLFSQIFLNRILSTSKVELDTVLRIVRRYPYWLAGHIYIAEQSLKERDVGRAYAAAQAVLASVIPGGLTFHKQAEFILARCHLSKGAPATALQLFENVENEVRQLIARTGGDCREPHGVE